MLKSATDFSWLQRLLLSGEFWQQKFLGNSLGRYATALVVLVIAMLILRILKKIILKKLKKLADSTESRVDDIIIDFVDKTLFPLFLFGAFYIAVNQINLNPSIKKLIDALGVAFIAIQGTRFALSVTFYLIDQKWAGGTDSRITPTTFGGIKTILKIVFWGLCVTFMLDNFGFDISTVVAGLGIGGVAIALASQNILNDLFNYFVIFFDRPFEKGDFIIIGDYMGCIEYVGIKTTRIASLGGEQIVVSNSDLTGSRIRNYKKMQKRRVVFGLGTTYGTTLEQLKRIPDLVRDIVGSIDDVVFDRCHFKSFGDFTLNIETVYYINGNDFNKYMDIQQDINLKIKEAFEKEGIEFAFPTQTIHMAPPAKQAS